MADKKGSAPAGKAPAKAPASSTKTPASKTSGGSKSSKK